MRRTLTITSEPHNLCTVRRLVNDFVSTCGIDPNEAELLVLGLDEACANIIRHAYGGQPGQRIQLTCDKLSGRIRFRLRDFGSQCNPSLLSTKLQERPLNCVRPGGLGLHFIRKAFDEIHFIPKEVGTELVLIKILPP